MWLAFSLLLKRQNAALFLAKFIAFEPSQIQRRKWDLIKSDRITYWWTLYFKSENNLWQLREHKDHIKKPNFWSSLKFIPYWMVLLAVFFSISKYYRRVSWVGTPSIDTDTCLTRASFWVFMRIWVHLLSTRIGSHPELSGGSLHPLEDLLTAGSAFIHGFLDFTHCTPSGQPKPDLLILPCKELPVRQFWHFCCLFCSRWFSSLSSSIWILALGLGSASIHSFLVSCNDSLRASWCISASSWVLKE